MSSKNKVLFVLLVFLAGCGITGNVAMEEPVKIGVMLSLTGNAAFFGEGELQGIKLAVEEANEDGGINGRRIKLVVEDIGSLNTGRAISALNKLETIDNVDAVIGPTWDMPGLSIAANEKEIVMISPDNTKSVEDKHDLEYFFSTWYPLHAETEALVKYSQDRGFENVVIVRDEDTFSSKVEEYFRIDSKKKDLRVTETIIVKGESNDFRTSLLKLQKLNSDAILLTLGGEYPKGIFLKQMEEKGMNITVLGTSSSQNDFIKENYAQYAEGRLFYSYPEDSSQLKEFYDKAEERFGKPPSGPAASNAYDAANILIEAMRSGAKSSEEIQEFLSTEEFDTITFGKMKFDSLGFVSVNSTNIIIKTVKNGEFIPITS